MHEDIWQILARVNRLEDLYNSVWGYLYVLAAVYFSKKNVLRLVNYKAGHVNSFWGFILLTKQPAHMKTLDVDSNKETK